MNAKHITTQGELSDEVHSLTSTKWTSLASCCHQRTVVIYFTNQSGMSNKSRNGQEKTTYDLLVGVLDLFWK